MAVFHIHAVPIAQEAQASALAHKLSAQVAGHDQHSVPKVHDASLSVGQAPVIQNLQKRVPNFGVGFLDFVKEHYAVRPAAHSFGKLTAFLVAHVSGRRAKKAAHGVLLAVLTHVYAHQSILIVKEELSQGFSQVGLTHTGRANENEAAAWPPGVFQT